MNTQHLKDVWNREKGEKYSPRHMDYWIRKDGDTAYIFLDPSAGFDWVRNFIFFKKKVYIGKHKVYVHRGFYKAYKELWKDVLPRLNGIKEVYLSAYSHGGGVLPLFMCSLRAYTDIKIKEAIGFACPKVFHNKNKAGLNYVKDSCHDLIRVKYGKDVVTNVPFNIQGFRHVGTEYLVKDIYKTNNLFKRLIKPFTNHADYKTYF